MNVGELLTEYERSYFADRDFVPEHLMATEADVIRAKAEYEADPVKALMENVERARVDVRETAARVRLAKQDGLLDRGAYRQATPDEQVRWRRAVDLVKGDHQRAVSDFKHWKGYVEWAMEEQRAKAADSRLPKESDGNDERREVQADERPDHPDQQPGAGGVRDGHVQDGEI